MKGTQIILQYCSQLHANLPLSPRAYLNKVKAPTLAGSGERDALPGMCVQTALLGNSVVICVPFDLESHFQEVLLRK